LFLRQAPSRTAEVLKTLPDGTTLQVVGANKTVEDVVWRNVRDSDGNEGWVSAGYVVPIE
jgi:SH3-like domain-containing protein